MGRFAGSIGLVVLVVALRAPVAGAEPEDCQAARCSIQAEIDAECPCEEARNHGRYLACVVRVVNRAVREKRVPKACRNTINGCFIRSLCGKREATVLCDLPGDGPSGRCRPILSADHCLARGGEEVSTCCEACDATTPTPSAPGPTPTPGPTTSGVGATASAALPSATPSTAAATPTPAAPPTATPVVSSTSVAGTPTSAASATASVTGTATPTASSSAGAGTATPLVVATPTAAPATASAAAPTSTTAATPTTGAPTATGAAATPTAAVPTGTAVGPSATTTAPVVTPSGAATPSPTTAPSLLFVSVDAEPDDGPAPLAVQWTSDVSGGTLPYRYRWSFGDGTPDDTSANPSHVYRSVGDFTTTLTVTDALGQEDSDDWDVTVSNE